jgi:hypothetical protein
MNIEAIDWSKAPEDATHFCTDNDLWYKFTSNRVYVSEGCVDSWDLSAFSGTPDKYFVPRPVPSEQPVSAEVETAISTETHSIEPKPPLGLTPKNIWEEQMQHQRRQDIHTAVQRYISGGKEIPNDWLHELIELNIAIGNVKAQEILAEVGQSVEGGGWIEWGRKITPDIPNNTTVEKVYSDGDVTVGRNGDSFWYGQDGLDDKPYVVARYRIINEETE